MRSLLFDLVDRWLAPAPDTLLAPWLREWEFAHRGLHGRIDGHIIPENSTAGFAAAIERGMGIECDVQASREFQAMVFHDWDLDRLTDETGPLLDRSAADIGQIALTANAEPIPYLGDLLQQVDGKVPLLVEVKSRRDFPVDRLCTAIFDELVTYEGNVAVMSFDPRVSRWFADNAHQIVRGLVMTEEGKRGWFGSLERHMSLWHAKPDFLAYDIRDLPSAFAASQRERGISVTSWTVRSLELRARAALHADAPIAEGAGVA